MSGVSGASRRPRVSIVIVAWNALGYIRPCLDSVLGPALEKHPGGPAPGLENADVEVFVVDNGSTDGTADAVAAAYPRVRLIRLGENRGYPAANNVAFRTILAEGSADVVVLLNADVVIADRAIERLADYLASRPGVAAALPALVLANGRFQAGACGFLPTAGTLFTYFFGIHVLRPLRARGFFIHQKGVAKRVPYHPVEWLSGACLALRRETIERVGPMCEDYFFYAEDLDWGRRMKAAGLVLHYLPEVRVLHHHGATYQGCREINVAWLRMLFKYLRAERGRPEYLLGRAFAAAGFFLRTIAYVVRFFPWTRKASRRKIREVFRFFTFSLTGT